MSKFELTLIDTMVGFAVLFFILITFCIACKYPLFISSLTIVLLLSYRLGNYITNRG
jgi:hypothetical protein